MALNFTQLALHLQLAAVKKLEFKDFSEFLKSSIHTRNHFKNVKSRFPLSISWINIMGEGIYIYSENKSQSYDMKWKDWLKAMSNRPFWIECKQLDISVSDNADYAEILSGFVERGFKITKLSLRFPTDTLCNLAVIDDILKTFSCKALCLYYYSNQSVTNYNYIPAFSKLNLLQLTGSLTSTLLRAFHTQRLILCGMADTRMGLIEKDLNDYLKDPSAKHLCFRSREGLFADRSDKVLLEGLPHSVLWTTEDHPQSPLSDIPWEWGGRAYIVKSKDSRLLVALAFEFFFCMDQLEGDTEEELKEDAWAYLRKILEKNLVV